MVGSAVPFDAVLFRDATERRPQMMLPAPKDGRRGSVNLSSLSAKDIGKRNDLQPGKYRADVTANLPTVHRKGFYMTMRLNVTHHLSNDIVDILEMKQTRVSSNGIWLSGKVLHNGKEDRVSILLQLVMKVGESGQLFFPKKEGHEDASFRELLYPPEQVRLVRLCACTCVAICTVHASR